MTMSELIPWGTVRYIDCLDPDKGLPSLPDKSVELGYVDPPWGVGMDVDKPRVYNAKILKWDPKKTYFKDEFNPEWNLAWFSQLERVCEGVISVISEKHKYWWIRNTDPKDDIMIHWKNGFAASHIARHRVKSTYLFYGKFKKRLHRDVITSVLKWGFLKTEKWIHPTPKGIEIAVKILKQLKAESLIDCFAGSGSYLKAADVLGMKWFGYELDPVYKRDINKRFSKRTLDSYL